MQDMVGERCWRPRLRGGPFPPSCAWSDATLWCLAAAAACRRYNVMKARLNLAMTRLADINAMVRIVQRCPAPRHMPYVHLRECGGSILHLLAWHLKLRQAPSP